jgi:hypothetical protein
MPGSQITVTDRETGHKGEIKSVNDAPSLYVPDQKSGSDHCKKNPGEDRPDEANKPKELCEEDAPNLPWSHWSPTERFIVEETAPASAGTPGKVFSPERYRHHSLNAALC